VIHDPDVGWETDLAIHELSGASVEDHGDHLVVRTPQQPTFHWGNCVLARGPEAADDAGRWVGVFRDAFPAATWVAVGLRRMPADPDPWAVHGVELEPIEVLATGELPRRPALADRYEARRLEGDDWEQTVTLAVAENASTGSWDTASYEAFSRTRAERSRAFSDREDGVAAYFGAFADGVLAAHLGIVRCGGTARYQSVFTDASHRRRGLASHLVGVAASWAADCGCDRWVIVTEKTNPAFVTYMRAGFQRAGSSVQAYKPR
jgi:GNAT superfamily N-acetyltransferase